MFAGHTSSAMDAYGGLDDLDLPPEAELDLLSDFLNTGDCFLDGRDGGQLPSPARQGRSGSTGEETNVLAAPTVTGSIGVGGMGGSVHGPARGAGAGLQTSRDNEKGEGRSFRGAPHPVRGFVPSAAALQGGSVHGGAGRVVGGMPLNSMWQAPGRAPGPARPLQPELQQPFQLQSLPSPSYNAALREGRTIHGASNFQVAEAAVRNGFAFAPGGVALAPPADLASPSRASAGGGATRALKLGAGATKGAAPGRRPSVSKKTSLGAIVGVPSSDKQYHPQVEKARRDRINRLLNELRLLVPAAPEQLTGGVDKRAKHTVLEDTIALLRSLQATGGLLGQGPDGGPPTAQPGDPSGNDHGHGYGIGVPPEQFAWPSG